MSEAELTPLQAAAALREMEGMDERLKARIHGLTWLFWAVASPATFLTYAFAASSYGAREVFDQGAGGHGVPGWFGLLWMPWAAVGFAFTLLLWRSVGFALPGKRLSAREAILQGTLFLLATIGLVLASFVSGLEVYPSTVVLLGLGLIMGVLGVREAVAARRSAEAIAQTALGVALMAFAVSEAAVLSGEPSYAGLATAAVWNAAASGVAFAVVGLLRILRA